MNDDFIAYGQAVLTKEEYLANKEYYDSTGFVGVTGTQGIKTGVDGGFEYYKNILKYLEESIDRTDIKYRLGGGSINNPYEKDIVLIDGPHFVSWYIKNTGYTDMTDDDAKSGIDILLYTDLLDEVSPLLSSSDDVQSKRDNLSKSVLGDILFFDTYQRNGTVGIYLGSGKILLVDENNNRVYNLWLDNSDGTIEYTYWMDKFNGTIKRIPKLNKDDYIWHAKIMD